MFDYIKFLGLDLSPLPKVGLTTSSPLETILKIVFTVLGVVSVIVIMIAGVRFMTARGDPQGTAKARDTIIYAAVGLAVAILASTILNFVIGNL